MGMFLVAFSVPVAVVVTLFVAYKMTVNIMADRMVRNYYNKKNGGPGRYDDTPGRFLELLTTNTLRRLLCQQQ